VEVLLLVACIVTLPVQLFYVSLCGDTLWIRNPVFGFMGKKYNTKEIRNIRIRPSNRSRIGFIRIYTATGTRRYYLDGISAEDFHRLAADLREAGIAVETPEIAAL